MAVSHEEFEGISHYVTEPVAKGLARRYPLAAAKIHRSLAIRILGVRKSKYYPYALGHSRRAKELYQKNGQEESWRSLVEHVRKDHSREHSFIGDVEAIVAGERPTSRASFEKQLRTR